MGPIEVIKDRLYYSTSSPPFGSNYDSHTEHWFTLEGDLIYAPFFLDFGPYSLGCLYRFCQVMNSKLSDKSLQDKRIIYYSEPQMASRANSMYLLAAYLLLFLDRSPEEAMQPFARATPPVSPWHDATQVMDTFNLSTLDVLRGISKARKWGFFSFDKFDYDDYCHYEKVQNGDMNWLIEGRFLAFGGPHDNRIQLAPGLFTASVDDLIAGPFRRKGITSVIRFNKRYYNENRFIAAGISHHDMYFLDGSNPPEPILQRFLNVCENTSGAIAVHCKAGLGRTGTCIGAYIMKHYQFTAREVIGWMRVCRPGCVIGPQQQYLESIQQRMWGEGEQFRFKHTLAKPASFSLLLTSVKDEEFLRNADEDPVPVSSHTHSQRSSPSQRDRFHTSGSSGVFSTSSPSGIHSSVTQIGRVSPRPSLALGGIGSPGSRLFGSGSPHVGTGVGSLRNAKGSNSSSFSPSTPSSSSSVFTSASPSRVGRASPPSSTGSPTTQIPRLGTSVSRKTTGSPISPNLRNNSISHSLALSDSVGLGGFSRYTSHSPINISSSPSPSTASSTHSSVNSNNTGAYQNYNSVPPSPIDVARDLFFPHQQQQQQQQTVKPILNSPTLIPSSSSQIGSSETYTPSKPPNRADYESSPIAGGLLKSAHQRAIQATQATRTSDLGSPSTGFSRLSLIKGSPGGSVSRFGVARNTSVSSSSSSSANNPTSLSSTASSLFPLSPSMTDFTSSAVLVDGSSRDEEDGLFTQGDYMRLAKARTPQTPQTPQSQHASSPAMTPRNLASPTYFNSNQLSPASSSARKPSTAFSASPLRK